MQRYEARPMVARPTNSLAVASLVCGVLSFFVLPVVGAIAALWTGYRAQAEIARTGEQGAQMARLGIVLGWIHLAAMALAIVGVLAVILFLFVFAAHH